jgi:hypothetical protein
MKSFNWLFDPFDSGSTFNPVSGLPMLGDSGLDIAGNPFGTDFFTHADPFGSSSMFDSTGSSFESFGSHPWD